MGRQESLTSLALGRGPYENEVIETTDGTGPPSSQRYNSSGRPRNPTTKRLEREHVRAANEVMQVTGIVEDSIAARIKANESLANKHLETLTGLRLMEVGRAVLVAGVWGVLGLRRRILLYRPYSLVGISQLIKIERAQYSVDVLFFTGIPAVIAYHLSDWVAFFVKTVFDSVFEDESAFTDVQLQVKNVFQGVLDVSFSYITLHLRLFAILQQLHLIPASKLLPGLRSFVPFTSTSPIALPPPLSLNMGSIMNCGMAFFRIAAPMLAILVHGKVKYIISRLMYRPIYKTLPRPTGDSMFAGLAISAPGLEYDTPDQDRTRGSGAIGQDDTTLRALEGLPTIEPPESRPRVSEGAREDSDDEDTEVAQATLISFDVEATEGIDASRGTWSAELRSANEPKVSKDVKYRVTGVTMLPTIMATEGFREVVAGILVMPLEAIMVRTLGRAFRGQAGMGVEDMWSILPNPQSISLKNIIPALGIQVVATGVVWAGYTIGTHMWVMSKRESLEADKKEESSTS